jgi:hypothetical protein
MYRFSFIDNFLDVYFAYIWLGDVLKVKVMYKKSQ